MAKVALLGKEMKSALKKNKDPTAILNKFADDLIILGSGKKSKPSHGAADISLKNKQSGTPSAGLLFGRGKSSKADHVK